MRAILLLRAVCFLLGVCVCFVVGGRQLTAQDAKEARSEKEALAADLELLQGTWELVHGNEGNGSPTLHSVKEIKGSRERLRRYDLRTQKLIREHAVEFLLTSSGSVRVLTFYPVGGDPKDGLSCVYKVDADYFYDVPGLLQGDQYRNYQPTPAMWRWKRVKEGVPFEPGKVKLPEPRAEIDPALLKAIEATGAKVYPRPEGYSIDVRRKPFFTDKSLEVIAQCPQLLDLTMENVTISDRGLAKFRELKQLNRLILNDCPISAAGLQVLAELPLHETLMVIGLRGTQLKEDDLKVLSGFPKLERVDASQTAITDASLAAIGELKLKVLDITGVKVTRSALDRLREQNPELLLRQ